MFDGSASWWTQAIGHGNSAMALAIGEAAGRYGHILAPKNLHPTMVKLSQYLVEEGPGKGWGARVFFTDNGSTGMEVAIKMALRLHVVRSGRTYEDSGKEMCVLSQSGCYHGDTLGTMVVSEPNPYNADQHLWYKPRTVAIVPPTVAYVKGRLEIDASGMGCEKVSARYFNYYSRVLRPLLCRWLLLPV